MRGSVRKRGTTWSIRVYTDLEPATNQKKQKEIGGYKTKPEAEAALAEMINKVNKGEYFDTEKMPLKDYLPYWLKTYKPSVCESTYKRYSELLNHAAKHIGNVPINQLKPMQIQNFYSNLIEEDDLSGSTILKIHRVLHLALNQAVMWQMIISNPCGAVKPPRAETVEMQVWDEDTVNRFYTDPMLFDNLIYLPSVVALQTGLRLGEICGLKWSYVNTLKGSISVVNNLQYLNGRLILKEPKTKKSVRNIALIKGTIEILKMLRLKYNSNKILHGSDFKDDGYVFCNEFGEPINPHYISKRFKIVIDSMQYPSIRFHDLRHTHATLLLAQGINPKIVSERLGHSTIAITLDTYSHVLPDMQQQAVEALNNVF